MGQRHILHCDCNCFYASVEMQEHPELRGKSIAVCGDPEARHGIVLTASYPAKRMGVKTGMPIWEAKQHCRDLIIVPASYGKYQKYSGYVREVFNDYTDQVESFGLDEAWLDITGSVGLFGSPVKIAKEISVRMIQREKRYVEVDVRFSTEGRLRPLQIIFDKGQVYKIDKIKDICRRAADVGGVGDRYTCMIQGKERELWFEDGRWFVAAKVATKQAPPSNA